VVLLAPSMRWLLYSPLGQAIDAITDPILLPIRSIMPSFGMLDLSPMIAIILLQVIGQAVANAV
jgi:YggT family protein